MVVFHLKWRRKKITPSYRNTKFYPWWQSEQGRCCGHLSSLQAGVKGIELGEEYKYFPRVEISYVCCELINWWGWEGDNMELRSDNQGNSKQGITSRVEHGGASILLWQFDDCIDVHTILGKHWDDLKDLWNCQDSEWSNSLTIDPEWWKELIRIENWELQGVYTSPVSKVPLFKQTLL